MVKVPVGLLGFGRYGVNSEMSRLELRVPKFRDIYNYNEKVRQKKPRE